MDSVCLPQGYKVANGRQFTFNHQVPQNFWYTFYQPLKDTRLSIPGNYQEVLKIESLN